MQLMRLHLLLSLLQHTTSPGDTCSSKSTSSSKASDKDNALHGMQGLHQQSYWQAGVQKEQSSEPCRGKHPRYSLGGTMSSQQSSAAAATCNLQPADCRIALSLGSKYFISMLQHGFGDLVKYLYDITFFSPTPPVTTAIKKKHLNELLITSLPTPAVSLPVCVLPSAVRDSCPACASARMLASGPAPH